VTRVIIITLALAVGVAAGMAVCQVRSRTAASALARRAEKLAGENDQLRGERDQLQRELAECRRIGGELRDASERVRSELESKLSRLEQLVAALVGTRAADTPSPSPAAIATPLEGR
jgi:uncharacterized protein YlxW (UPF0749 family)